MGGAAPFPCPAPCGLDVNLVSTPPNVLLESPYAVLVLYYICCKVENIDCIGSFGTPQLCIASAAGV